MTESKFDVYIKSVACKGGLWLNARLEAIAKELLLMVGDYNFNHLKPTLKKFIDLIEQGEVKGAEKLLASLIMDNNHYEVIAIYLERLSIEAVGINAMPLLQEIARYIQLEVENRYKSPYDSIEAESIYYNEQWFTYRHAMNLYRIGSDELAQLWVGQLRKFNFANALELLVEEEIARENYIRALELAQKINAVESSHQRNRAVALIYARTGYNYEAEKLFRQVWGELLGSDYPLFNKLRFDLIQKVLNANLYQLVEEFILAVPEASYQSVSLASYYAALGETAKSIEGFKKIWRVEWNFENQKLNNLVIQSLVFWGNSNEAFVKLAKELLQIGNTKEWAGLREYEYRFRRDSENIVW